MNTAGLSVDQAPPIKYPFMFFVGGVFMLILAAFFGVFFNVPLMGGIGTLMLLHVVSIGFMLAVVVGSLMQMLPVVMGAVIKPISMVSYLTFFSIFGGLLSVLMGVHWYNPFLLKSGCFLLGLGVAVFFSSAIISASKVPKGSIITWGIFCSLVCFLVGGGIGVFMLSEYISFSFIPLHVKLLTLHKSFIFFGGIGLLIASVSIQVIPMFWICEPYSKPEQHILFSMPLLSVLISFFDKNGSYMLFGFFMVFYSFVTHKKFKNRKRNLKDSSIEHWQLALFFGLLAVFLNAIGLKHAATVLYGGFVIFIMIGMLYKIIPFLVWFHLSALGIFDVPTMREMLSTKKIQLTKYLLFFSAVFFCLHVDTAGFLAFLLAGLILFINIIKPIKIYKNKTALNVS